MENGNSQDKIRLCIAGATGWAGSELSKGVAASSDIELVSAVARHSAGKDLNDLLPLHSQKPIPVFATIEEALEVGCDVLIDYTSPKIAKHNAIYAISNRVNTVVGTSGLTDQDYDEIAKIAEREGRSVLAVGNFAISVVLLNKFSEIAARYMPHWEIIDYADSKKPDAPSGSALELANRLSKIGRPAMEITLDKMHGIKESRGANFNGTQVHAVRLPGYIISLESIFGMESEKLIIRHEAGSSAIPYVAGALLAIRRVGSFTGLKRGLDAVMDFSI